MNHPVIEQIEHWFETAYPNPDDARRVVQMGVHFEEVNEMLVALQPDLGKNLGTLTLIKDLATEFKSAGSNPALLAAYTEHVQPFISLVLLLDALCDQIVTAVGVAHMFGFDLTGALCEVADSNDSKFGADGNPIFDVNGKVAKGPLYFKPNLIPYLTKGAQREAQ